MNKAFSTIRDITQGVRTRSFSAVEVCDAYLARIDTYDATIGAYLHRAHEAARRQAQDIDTRIKSGEDVGPLAGVPVAVKDNILVRGMPATAGSEILEGYRAVYDATAVRRLREAGAVILGKTNLDEFGMGASTEHSAFAKTVNPWDVTRVPGGSSGGSAAAVAMSMACVALGTDTGGSIRQPSSFCGVTGLRPSYGRVSRYGDIAMTSSIDQIGPIARSAEDAERVFRVICGRDPLDATTVEHPHEAPHASSSLKGVRIGIPKEFFPSEMDPGVAQKVREAAKTLEKLGASLVDVSLPLTPYALAVYYLTVTAEASSNLARYDGIRFPAALPRKGKLWDLISSHRGALFGEEVKRRIILGTFTLSHGYYDQYYLQAQKVRALMKKQYVSIFRDVDILLTPTAPTTAFMMGEKFEDPLMMYLADIFTAPAGITDVPAMSLPCGSIDRLPVGVQLMAAPFSEGTLFQVAQSYQENTDWHEATPQID